jgi:hypothetical protein
MGLLGRDDILRADDLRTEEVDVPEWGGAVRVKALTGAERDRYEASIAGDRSKGKDKGLRLENARARMVALCVVDAAGKAIFEPADVPHLGRKSAAALDRVFDVALRLAGMRDEDVEELVEDFLDDQGEDSTSN